MTEVMQVREAYRVEQWRQLMQQRKDSGTIPLTRKLRNVALADLL